jgi:hypothetical protein
MCPGETVTASAPNGQQVLLEPPSEASINPQLALGVPQHNNGFAIASMVLGLVWIWFLGSILAVIFGHIAVRQIRNSRGTERGRGMAIAGLILGYVGIALLALSLVAVAVFLNGDDHSTGGVNTAVQSAPKTRVQRTPSVSASARSAQIRQANSAQVQLRQAWGALSTAIDADLQQEKDAIAQHDLTAVHNSFQQSEDALQTFLRAIDTISFPTSVESQVHVVINFITSAATYAGYAGRAAESNDNATFSGNVTGYNRLLHALYEHLVALDNWLRAVISGKL